MKLLIGVVTVAVVLAVVCSIDYLSGSNRYSTYSGRE